MRHNKSGRRLGRTWSHRKAMFRNMARSLLTHGRIKTTEAKAKELRSVADKLITLALRNDLHARRQAYRVLENHQLVKKLFDEIGPRFVGVKGGYTRVVKLAIPRAGDCAPMAVIEFTSASGEEPKPAAKKATKAAKPAPAPAKEAAAEAPAQEAAPEEAAPEASAAEKIPESSAEEEPKAEDKPAE